MLLAYCLIQIWLGMVYRTRGRYISCDFGCGCELNLVCPDVPAKKIPVPRRGSVVHQPKKKPHSSARNQTKRKKPNAASVISKKGGQPSKRQKQQAAISKSSGRPPGMQKGQVAKIAKARRSSASPLKVKANDQKSRWQARKTPIEFIKSSLSLTKESKKLDEKEVARKAYLTSRYLFSSDFSTPMRQKPFTRVYKDTIQEESRKRKQVVSETRKHSIAWLKDVDCNTHICWFCFIWCCKFSLCKGEIQLALRISCRYWKE